MDVFKIDGVAYPKIHVVKLTRKFNILDGELAGRNVRGDMIRDVIGTYFNYTLELMCDNLSQDEYYELYMRIAAPTDFHKVTVPFNAAMYDFDAYITSGEDELKYMSETEKIWRGITCDFIAMKPTVRPKPPEPDIGG